MARENDGEAPDDDPDNDSAEVPASEMRCELDAPDLGGRVAALVFHVADLVILGTASTLPEIEESERPFTLTALRFRASGFGDGTGRLPSIIRGFLGAVAPSVELARLLDDLSCNRARPSTSGVISRGICG